MKKIIFSLASLSLLSQYSCNKKQTESQKEQKAVVGLMSAPSFKYYNFGTDITEADYLFSKDQKLNDFYYLNRAMTLGVMELLKSNPAMVTEMVNASDANNGKMLNLFDFANNHPEINDVFNAVFQDRYRGNFSGDWKEFVGQRYVYDETYVPFIMISNWANYDKDLAPMIVEAEEISEEKFTDFDNDYPLWIYDESIRDYRLTTLNINNIVSIRNPVISVVNSFSGDEVKINDNRDVVIARNPYLPEGLTGTAYFPPGASTMSCNLNPLPTGHIHETIAQRTFKILDRHENTGKSEYTIRMAQTRAYDPSSGFWGPYPVGTEHEVSKSVKPNQIGTTIQFDRTLFGPDMYTSPACFDLNHMYQSLNVPQYFCLGVYEWDLIATSKKLGKYTDAYGHSVEMTGHETFKGDYYFFNPDDNTGYPFPSRHPNPNSLWNYSNNGELQLSRYTN